MSNWNCKYFAKTRMWDGSSRKIEGYFECTGNLKNNLQKILNSRIKKPFIWFGVDIIICTPIGQKCKFLIEENKNDSFYDIILEETL